MKKSSEFFLHFFLSVVRPDFHLVIFSTLVLEVRGINFTNVKYLVLEGNVGYNFVSFLISHNLSFLRGCIMLEKYFHKNGL